MMISKIISSPARIGRLVGIVAGVCVLVVALNAIWLPRVDPLMPALPDPDSGISVRKGPSMVTDSVDFIFRPLFMPSRTPAVSRPVPTEDEETSPSDVVTIENALERYKLLGVFSSGGVAGAILGGPDGARQRLTIGESLDGWVLDEAAIRSVRFSSDRGSEAVLQLAVASELPVPEELNLQTSQGDDSSLPSGVGAVDREMTQDQNRRPVRQPLTFESMANQKRDEAMARKADADKVSGSSQ